MANCLTLKKSNCKNCYKCIRNCPVKAIKFSGNQAQIIGNECILCGQCFVACPQNAREIVQETEKVKEMVKESSSKEENTVQTGVPIGDITGMYEYGNWFEHRDVESPAGTEDTETTMEENAKKSESVVLEPKMSEKKNPVHVVTPVWYTTPIGKTVIVSAGTLAAGTMIGALLWLYLFSVPVYCMEEKNRLYHLGRVLLHRTRDGYSVYLSDFMLQTSTLPKYRIKVSGILLKKMENERLLIESEEKNLEVLIQETIDFEL